MRALLRTAFRFSEAVVPKYSLGVLRVIRLGAQAMHKRDQYPEDVAHGCVEMRGAGTHSSSSLLN